MIGKADIDAGLFALATIAAFVVFVGVPMAFLGDYPAFWAVLFFLMLLPSAYMLWQWWRGNEHDQEAPPAALPDTLPAQVASDASPQSETAITRSHQGVVIMTTTANIPSNHPLRGKWGAFDGIMGFVVDVLVALALVYAFFYVTAPTTPLSILSLNYSWELAAVAAAFAYYIVAAIFSVRRERSPVWAGIDVFGTILVALVLIYAALSLHPVIAATLRTLGAGTLGYTSLNMAILVSFSVAIILYIYRFHFRRSEVGLEGIQSGVDPKTTFDNGVDATMMALGGLSRGFTVIKRRPGFKTEVYFRGAADGQLYFETPADTLELVPDQGPTPPAAGTT